MCEATDITLRTLWKEELNPVIAVIQILKALDRRNNITTMSEIKNCFGKARRSLKCRYEVESKQI